MNSLQPTYTLGWAQVYIFYPVQPLLIGCHAHAVGINSLSCVQASLGGQGVVGKQDFEKTEAGHDESPSVLW
ncbi:hypothetical protein ACYCFK_02100 [Stutzerimonas stutzeri]